jgi:hypothetical protein
MNRDCWYPCSYTAASFACVPTTGDADIFNNSTYICVYTMLSLYKYKIFLHTVKTMYR